MDSKSNDPDVRSNPKEESLQLDDPTGSAKRSDGILKAIALTVAIVSLIVFVGSSYLLFDCIWEGGIGRLYALIVFAPAALISGVICAAFFYLEGRFKQVPATTENQSLKHTGIGLLTVNYGIWAVMLATLTIFLKPLVFINKSWAMTFTARCTEVLLEFVIVVAGGGGYLAILIGQILCLTGLREIGCRRCVQIAVAMQAVLIPLHCWRRGVMINFFNIVGLIGFFCFLYFLKNLSLYARRHDLASSSSATMKLVVAVALMHSAILYWISMIYRGFGTSGFFWAQIITMTLSWIVLIRLANLMRRLARAIPD